MNDRRKRRRVELAWILRLPHERGGHIQSRTVNVSGTGVLFLSSQSFAKNQLIPIEMDVSTGCTVKAIIRIAREVQGSSRIYRYGAEFVEFADNDYERLEETLIAILQRMSGSNRINPANVNSAPKDPTPVANTSQGNTRMPDHRWGPTIADSPDAHYRRG